MNTKLVLALAALSYAPLVVAGNLELPSELYLTTQIESRRSYRVAMRSLDEPLN